MVKQLSETIGRTAKPEQISSAPMTASQLFLLRLYTLVYNLARLIALPSEVVSFLASSAEARKAVNISLAHNRRLIAGSLMNPIWLPG